MRGRTVNFFTGLCLYNSATGRTHVRGIPTLVTFRQLSDTEIENYLRRSNPTTVLARPSPRGLAFAVIAAMEARTRTHLSACR